MLELSLPQLKLEAREFIRRLNGVPIPELYGTNDGKTVGTYVELTFNRYLTEQYEYARGNAASGIDFPSLEVDLKVTSIRQPQSSSPFRNASQKVYGLGYHLLLFVYAKTDDSASSTARLNFQHAVFITRERTGDYQTTYGLRGILQRNGNVDDVIGFLEERNFPLDEIGREALANKILQQPPELGYLTISNALQWRLQYGRVIELATAGATEGLEKLLD
jgi:restriction system protein